MGCLLLCLGLNGLLGCLNRQRKGIRKDLKRIVKLIA